MSFDLAKVLDDSFDKSSLRLRVASVAGADPLTITYGPGDAPQPASRLGSYIPAAGHVVYVLSRGKGNSVVLGQVFTSTDAGGSVPVPPDGVWSSNLLTNGGFEYGFATWGKPNDFVPDQEWADSWELINAFMGESAYAARSKARTVSGTVHGPWAIQLQAGAVVSVTPGAIYRLTVMAKAFGTKGVWLGLNVGDTPENAWWGPFYKPDNSVGLSAWKEAPTSAEKLAHSFTVPNDPRWKYGCVSLSPTMTDASPNWGSNYTMDFDNVWLAKKLA